MASMSFGKKGNRVQANRTGPKPAGERPPEDVVRDLKAGLQRPPGEDYRDRSLAIHGLICARCAREFAASNQHLRLLPRRCPQPGAAGRLLRRGGSEGETPRPLQPRPGGAGVGSRGTGGEVTKGPGREGEKMQIADSWQRLTRSGQTSLKSLDFRKCLWYRAARFRGVLQTRC